MARSNDGLSCVRAKDVEWVFGGSRADWFCVGSIRRTSQLFTEVRMASAAVQNADMTEVWVRFKADPTNIELRNQLIERYTPLVRYNGERLRSKLPEGVDLDDLISAGIFGLMDAIDAFDLERGVKFETYCVPRIRGAMLDELRTMD